MNLNQVKLGLTSLMLLPILSCEVNSVLSNVWKVESIDITISEGMEYLEELKPGFVEERLKSRFPKHLKKDDIIDLNVKGKLIVNKTDTLQYYSDDSTLNITRSDALFTLNYKIDDEILIFKSSLDNSVIRWRFERLETSD